jgi:hypothetical protein
MVQAADGRLLSVQPVAEGPAASYLLEAGQTWTAESVITTAKEVQRIEVITGVVDPVRILASGIASQRAVSTADGDIYAAGIAGQGGIRSESEGVHEGSPELRDG